MHLSKAHSKIRQECYNIRKNVTVQKTLDNNIIVVPNNIKIASSISKFREHRFYCPFIRFHRIYESILKS